MYTYPYKTIGNILPKIKDSVDDIYISGLQIVGRDPNLGRNAFELGSRKF